MFKTYQFKTHCKGNIHSSKTANIILPKTHHKTQVKTLMCTSKIIDLFNCKCICSLKQLMSLNCTCKGVHLFCHESWQNDICSFRAMNFRNLWSYRSTVLTQTSPLAAVTCSIHAWHINIAIGHWLTCSCGKLTLSVGRWNAEVTSSPNWAVTCGFSLSEL